MDKAKSIKSPIALFLGLVFSFLGIATVTGTGTPNGTGKEFLPLLEAPRSLKAVAVSHNSVRLFWSAGQTGNIGYEIERKLLDGEFAKIGESAAPDSFFVDENLLTDTVYVYRVRAVQGNEHSTYSNHYQIHISAPVSHIPAGVMPDPDGIPAVEPLENNLISWGEIETGEGFPVFGPGDCLDGDFYLGFQLAHDLGNFNTALEWDSFLDITLFYDQDSLWTKPLQLSNGEQTFLATMFHDATISCDPDYRFVIREKTGNGSVPGSNVSLRILLYEKQDSSFSAQDPILLDHQSLNTMSLVTWDHTHAGTHSYDLEWVFISEHENFTGTTAQAAFGFKEPVRINTPYNSYSHHLFYPEGKVWYRIRALGYHPDFPGHRTAGIWNYGADAGLAVENASENLNWQLQTTFAEGGKYRNLVQYMDGSLRKRQAVTNLNTGEMVMVGETKYDFEGRESLEILPAPVEGTSLVFRPNFNVFSATDPDVSGHTSTGREKFHYDNGSLTNSPLGSGSGAGKYYSPANDVAMRHRDFVPDSEGFPYSQKTYTPDGTGRIALQSGVGEKFRTDGDRPTRYYYGEASTEELIRLFGMNAGEASHYRKNMTVDPNGQVSLTYMDQEGRAVATALGGVPPVHILEPLEIYTVNQEAENNNLMPGTAGDLQGSMQEDREAMEQKALLAEEEKLNNEFLKEEEALLEERYGEMDQPLEEPQSIQSQGQLGLMAAMLPGQEEYQALMDLYQSTNGSSWNYKNGWLNADPQVVQSVAGWTGVTVNGNGNITALYLPNNNLTGPLPPSFVDLEHLVAVNLFNNNLNGTIPDSIGQLDQLVELRLNNNKMTGSIPSGIGGLVNLTMLTLHNNLLSGNLPSGLGNLGKLTEINLYNNAFTGPIPSSFGKLSSLKVLSASFNQLSGPLPDSLGYMHSLTALRLERNLLEGPLPSSLGNLQNLTEIILYYNRIGGSLPESLGRLTKLLKIEMHNNLFTGPIPESLGNLQNLTEIHLFYNLLSGRIPASLGKLKKLKRLLLNNNNIVGTLPAELGNLAELTQFNIHNNNISGTLPANFGNLKKLTQLSLGYNNLSGSLPHNLKNLSSLNNLNLQFNQFEGPLPPDLAQLSYLTVLDIGYNMITGPMPEGLEDLNLSNPPVANNFLSFRDLLPLKQKLTAFSKYYPQRKVDLPKAHNIKEGESLTLSASVDKETDPPTEFRWFRGSQAVNQRSASGHTVVLENVSAADAGNYYYNSWNSALPELTLTSEFQNVNVEAPGWKSITVDLMSHNRVENNRSTVHRTFLNTVPDTPYNISYELSGLGTQLEGIGCQSCSFELEIYLLDPEGKPVNLGNVTGNTSPDNFSFRNTYTVEDCMVVQTPGTVSIGDVTLENLGEYTVVKELGLASPSFEHARAEIQNSAGFAAQLASLDSIYESYGECVFCTEEVECPGAEEAIDQAMAETADLSCENIREGIIAQLEANGSYTEQDILSHPGYCQYLNCMQNKEAAIFESSAIRVGGWIAAGTLGYHNMEDHDPFYNHPELGGNGKKPTLMGFLNSIAVGPFTGTILQVTDPANTSLYYADNGQPDPVNGKHLLYGNLLDQRAEMGETWYQEKLDEQRWMLFRNFYFEASRKTKLQIPAFAQCGASMAELENMETLPTAEADMQAWAVTQDLATSVDSIQVDAIRYMLVEGCGENFSLSESNSLYAHLEAYFNSNRMTNPYNLLLAEDISSDPSLGAIEDILSGKGCSLMESGLAVTNPMICLRDTLIYTYAGTNQQYAVESEIEQNNYFSDKPDRLEDDADLLRIEEEKEQEEIHNGILEYAEVENSMAPQSFEIQSLTLPTPGEYTALMDFYGSTNGGSWLNKTGWQDADPEVVQSVQGWHGITANSNGNIIRIDLGNNQLSGELLPSLGDLSQLVYLNLSGNNLTGTIPDSLGNFSHLIHLNLHSNQLTGSIPPGLGNLSNLTNLWLSSNQLSGSIPVELGNLSQMRRLDLFSNQLSGSIPSTLGNLSNLAYLNLYTNQLTGSIPPELGNLPSLGYLQLYQNQLSGQIPPELGNLSNVLYFHLYSNQLEGSIPPELGNLSKLRNLALHYNQLTGSIPSNLGNLSNLSNLWLQDNQLSGSIPPELGNLYSLTYLLLYENQLTGSIPPELGNLSNLTFLYLDANQITGSIPPELGNLSKLLYLYLDTNQLTGSIPPELGNLSNLLYLYLNGNQLSGSIPPELGNLSKLLYLHLDANQLSGSIPSTLGNLSSLRYLRLYSNQLTGSIPPELGNLSNLLYLHLDANQLSGVVPLSLGNLTKLSSLQLMGNQLMGTLPASFAQISSLGFRNNLFNFQDLSLISENLRTRSSTVYNPQGNVDTLISHNVIQGQSFTLSASVDRNTDPPSQYQWFKNNQAINQRSVDGHTITMDTANVSDGGTYLYRIWNESLPILSLQSHPQTVNVVTGQPVRYCLEYEMGDAQGGYGQPGTSPSMALFSLQTSWAAIMASCVADNEARAGALKDLAAEKLMDIRLEEYFAQYDLKCLENITEEFSYTYTPREYHYTLYYYDQSGSLVQTVPPKGVQPLSGSQVDLVKAGTAIHPAHTLPTRYRYNSRDQLTGQESPDAGESRFWYNKAGQLRMSQDARKAATDAYSYTKYDRQGRVTETGEFLSVENTDSLKSKLNDPAFPESPAYTCHDITLTFYDRAKPNSDSSFVQENLRGRVSWTAMAERGEVDTVFTLYSYDPHGNVNALLQDLPGLGPKRTEYRYDLVSGNVNLVLYQYGRPEQFIHRYSYDADNRIEEVHTSTDGFVWNREASYTYYPHGPLARVELGEYNVQGMDYYYTLQGWLKGVNMPMAGDPGGDGIGSFRTGKDAFAFALGYYEGDYKPINPNVTLSDSRDKLWDRYKDIRDTTAAHGLYNGNISWMSTDLPGLENRMQAMVYGYDQLHRIVQARSLKEYGPTGYQARASGANGYDVDYSYDPNGNLLTLQRLDQQTAVQDDLTYEYYELSNKLKNVDGSVDENYSYDEIGNLISDTAEGIDSIVWTPYGKVRKVEKDDNTSLSFRYDAAGNRIAKITERDTTVYVRDASGNVMGVYKNDTLVEQSIYGSSRLGLLTKSSKTGYRTLGGKKYELSNHLGNVLAVVTDNINFDQDSTWAEVSSITDYYPFGLAMDGRTEQDSTYRYGFNGMEGDDEIKGNGNSYTSEFRQYDPRLGRWLSLDPQMKKYPDLTPYSSFANNPLIFVDVNGDTITLAGTVAEQKVALAHLRILTNDKLALKGNMLIISNLGSENPGKNLKAGTTLIRELNKKGQPDAKNVSIVIGASGSANSASPDSRTAAGKVDWTMSTNGTGDNATVNFDPTANPLIKTEDPVTGNVSGQTRPDEIGLGHELIHAKHMNDGDVSFTPISHTYQTPGGPVNQSVINEELRTVGVKGTKKGDITENQIRKEQGLNKRGAY